MARATKAAPKQFGIDVGAGRSFFGKPGIPCLSVQQPWAYAIWPGPKPIENRGWGEGYRGPLLLHVGKSLERDTPEVREWFAAYVPLLKLPASEDLPRGVIYAAANVVLATKDRARAVALCADPAMGLLFADTNEGNVCFVLADVVGLEIPINWRGERMIFRVPSEVVADQLSGWKHWPAALAAERSCR